MQQNIQNTDSINKNEDGEKEPDIENWDVDTTAYHSHTEPK